MTIGRRAASVDDVGKGAGAVLPVRRARLLPHDVNGR